MSVSIVVSPRERFSSVTRSLRSLFSSIEPDVPVVVVEGGSPDHVRLALQEMQKQRHFIWIKRPYLITPQEARNIGFSQVETDYVVFADNDIEYEPRWLDKLQRNAEVHGADLVAPLICIGPPTAKIVHHAGGRLVITGSPNDPRVTEKHRLMKSSIEQVTPDTAPIENEIVEFHCFLARSDYIRQVGGMDERLVTREQIDFGLRAKLYGAKVTFEAGAIVTYMASMPFEETDLRYLSFRWSDSRAKDSLRTFTSTWGITTEEKRVLQMWIRPHRIRAYSSVFAAERETLGKFAFEKIHVDYCEDIFEREASQARDELPSPSFPSQPGRSQIKSMFRRCLNPVERGADLSHPAVLRGKRLIVAGMATMPSRSETFEVALSSILPQVDQLYLFFDRFERPPKLRHPKIICLDSQTFGDHRANGKFLGLLFNRGDVYYASMDDDIEYPANYIDTMLGHVRNGGRNKLYSVHGSILNDVVVSYRSDRQVAHRKQQLDEALAVDIPSSCSSMFDTRELWFDVRQWDEVNMVDLHLAIECAKHGVDPWLVPRDAMWLKPLDESQPDSIYYQLRKNDRRQSEIARRLKQSLRHRDKRMIRKHPESV